MTNLKRVDFIKKLQPSAIRQIYDNAPQGAINFGLGEIQFPLAEFFRDKIQKIIDNNSLGYTPNAGLLELRKQICEQYKISFSGNVCITAGAEEALFACLFAHLNENDEVLIADPSYLAYETVIEMLECKPVKFDLLAKEGFHLNILHLEKAYNPNIKVCLLNNPSNPTGVSFTSSEMDQIVNFCTKHNILLVVDEVYRELYLTEKTATFLYESPQTIIISSLSKSHCLAGWRLGWAISQNSELIEPIIRTHQYISTCAPAISQYLAIEAFTKDGMNTSAEIRRKLMQNRYMLMNFCEMNKLAYIPNDSSPYLFINLKQDDWLAANELSKLGLIVIPGSAFGKNGKGFIRINYGLQRDQLEEGLRILKKYLQ